MVSNLRPRRPRGQDVPLKAPRGRQVFYEPTPEDRRKVKLLAGFGLRHREICLLMINPATGQPIDVGTLMKRYRMELDTGMTEADAQVAQAYFRQCVGARAEYDDKGNVLREEVKASVTAQIFWMKVRLGWRENVDHNVNIRGQIAVGTPAELAAMTDQELNEALRAEIRTAQLMLAGKMIEGEVTE